jgi:HNH endonuclease
MKHTTLPVATMQERAKSWLESDFYRSAIVLGLDIGLDGLGIYLRRGAEEIFAKTLDFELPEAEALAGRRQKRAWRHCRKNRATRLHRLKLLFEKHGLPWLSEERMSRALPFRERYRAITTGVASPEALSLCIRHCVMRRGFDYGGTEEGRFPWGESSHYSAANTWLATACITSDLADHLNTLAPELVAKRNPEEQEKKFYELVSQRLAWSKEHDIARVLAEHSKGGHDNLRFPARGFNFPRQNVWQHMEAIIRHPRHAGLISDVEGFIAALGINPNKQPNEKAASRARDRAVFFYNRKTRFDMERHWANKVNVCPFARHLDLPDPDIRCDLKENLAVRRWSILQFAATNRVELDIIEGKGKTKKKRNVLHRLNPNTIKALVAFVENHHAALEKNDKTAEPKWDDANDLIDADIVAVHGEKVKRSPLTKSDWNKSFASHLRDLLLTTAANRKQRASLCGESAIKLFDIATANGTNFTPESVTARLRAIGFYDWRRDFGADFNPYPQVECLLGKRIKRGKQSGELSPTHQGFLRRIFQEHKDKLGGAEAPDYCVVEVIGDPPRNTEQKREREKEMQGRRDERKKQFDDLKKQFKDEDFEDTGIASKRRRIQLHYQQHGRCPFTGETLPANPLDPDLELEHLFPEELGGLSVDENLVLTWRTVNGAKGKRTPLQASQAGLAARVNGNNFQFLPWDAMLKNTADMKWGKRRDNKYGADKKCDIFAWGTIKENKEGIQSHYNPDGSLRVPDFGNTTRVAQLARQLRAEVARWMNVENQPNEAARRIGTPSGWLAAQARKTWFASADYLKIRSNLVHHLLDAAVLAHIPPREGMNHVACGGIIFTEWESVRNESTQRTSFRLLTKALPELSPAPRLRHWFSDRAEYAVCPVLKLRSQSKAKSLGDDTFWRQVDEAEPTVAQRTVLDVTKIGSPEELLSILQRMGADYNQRLGKTENKLPAREQLAQWLDAKTDFAEGRSKIDPGPLKLTDGTPVKSIWKFDSKGSLAAPLGWSGRRNENGKLQSLRSLSLRFDRIEIWLGYNHAAAEKAVAQAEKEKRRAQKAAQPFDESKLATAQQAGWTYQKRLIPDSRALKHLKQLGFSFGRDKRRIAPDFMQNYPGEKKTLREIILGGKLLPFSVRMPRVIRKGDLFHLHLNTDGEIITDDSKPYWSNWYRATATGTVVEMKCAVVKPGGEFEMPPGLKESMLTRKAGSADLMAFLAGQLSAAQQAAKLNLRIPPAPTKPAIQNSGNLI